MRKTARTIEIPEDRPLTFEEFEDISSHAEKSTIWYVQNYSCHSSKLKSRLYEKGYPREEVNFVDEFGDEQSINIVDDLIQRLEDASFFDDAHYLRVKVKGMLDRGEGFRLIRQKLMAKGIPADEIDPLEDELVDDDDSLAAIQAVVDKVKRTSAWAKVANDEWKRDGFLRQKLYAKGFDNHLISEWFDLQE